MITITVELDINGHQQVIPQAVQIDVDEIGRLPFGEVHRYIDEKVKRWIAETVKFTWTVERPRATAKEREQVAA